MSHWITVCILGTVNLYFHYCACGTKALFSSRGLAATGDLENKNKINLNRLFQVLLKLNYSSQDKIF